MNKNKLFENYSKSWSENSKRIISSPCDYVKNIFFYIQEVGYFNTDASYFTQRENLHSYLVLYCVSGQGILTYDDEKFIISPKQAFWIDCEKNHDYRNYKCDNWEFYWVHFYGNGLNGYYNQYKTNNSPVIDFYDDTTVMESIKSIIHNEEHLDIRTHLLNSYELTRIMTQFLLYTNFNDELSFYMPRYLKEVKRDIERRFFEHITLDDLASRHCMDKYHLSKEFKKWIGFSPIEYVIKLRISNAKELLKNSELSVNEIAQRVGFNNTGHFINLFKKQEDMTPLKYRKIWR